MQKIRSRLYLLLPKFFLTKDFVNKKWKHLNNSFKICFIIGFTSKEIEVRFCTPNLGKIYQLEKFSQKKYIY